MSLTLPSSRRSNWPLGLAGLALVGAIGALDYATGPHLAVSVFFLAPIALVAWRIGRTSGLLMSVLAAMVWLLVDLLGTDYSSPWVSAWNSVVRLTFFIIVTVLLTRLKRFGEGLERTVEQRTAALNASEAKYRNLYNSMSEGVALHEVLFDDDGGPADYVILDANPAFETIMGVSRQQAIGAKASELYRTAQAPYLDVCASVASSGNPARFETDATPAGKSFRVSAFCLEGGKFATVIEDITERKQAEEALRQSQQRLSLHVQQTPLGVIEWDLGFRVTKWNPSAERIFGYSPEEAANQHAAFIVPASARSHVDGVWRELLARAGGRRSTNQNVTKAGRIIMCEWYNTPLIDAEGKVIGIASLVEDVTERELSRRELVRKNRDLETLLYVSSHDLREPLRAIQSFATLLNSRYAGRLDAKGQDFLGRVVRGGERMERLIEDILVLSRAQRTIQPGAAIPGAAIVAEVLDRLRGKVETTRAKVVVAESFPAYRADKTWAVQAVFNLVANALKFTRPGQPPDIEIAPYRASLEGQDQIGIVVRDRGPGVQKEHADRIFDLFQRAVPREVEGTGAGLAIVRQVAEKHGGWTWVQPRPGGGSDFVITFGTTERQEREPQ